MSPQENSKFTILVVEDEAPIRELIVAALRKDGYRVLEAGNPHDAIEILGSRLFEIHLLVADIIMPKMSGDKFAREVVAVHPSLKIIFASGSHYHELKPELANIPHLHIDKPYTAAALRAVV